jgi:hypothetical protein
MISFWNKPPWRAPLPVAVGWAAAIGCGAAISWAAVLVVMVGALTPAHAQTKVSALPGASALDGTETLPVVQSATTKKATTAQVKTYALSAPWTVPTRVVTAAGAVTIATSDYLVCVNKSSGAATTANLPSTPATGLTFVVQDCKGDAATNPITITPASGNIDGASTLVLNVNRQAVAITYTGSEWTAY